MNCENLKTVISSDFSSNGGGSAGSEEHLTINYGLSTDDGTFDSDYDGKHSALRSAQSIGDMEVEEQLELVYEEPTQEDDNSENGEYEEDDDESNEEESNARSPTKFNLTKKRLLTTFYSTVTFVSIILIIYFSVNIKKSGAEAKEVAAANAAQATEQAEQDTKEATHVEIPDFEEYLDLPENFTEAPSLHSNHTVKIESVVIDVMPTPSDISEIVDGLEDFDINSTFAPSDEKSSTWGPTTWPPTTFWWQAPQLAQEELFDDALFNETSIPSDYWTSNPTTYWWQQQNGATSDPTEFSGTAFPQFVPENQQQTQEAPVSHNSHESQEENDSQKVEEVKETDATDAADAADESDESEEGTGTVTSSWTSTSAPEPLNPDAVLAVAASRLSHPY